MKKKQFDELVESVREGGAILRGEIKASRTFDVEIPDVKQIRVRLKVTQAQFARLLGISVKTLQNWEQSRRVPQGPARVLLNAVAHQPATMMKVLRSENAKEKTAKKKIRSVA